MIPCRPLAAWLCLLAAPLISLRAADSAAGRPNVLFLFADDQRADTIAALGNPVIKTPNLDRLARAGLSFRCAYMQGGMNGATCVPSRAMLLSGRSLFHIDEKLMRDETWPAAFGRAGYTTFISGKWHNGAGSISRSFQIARSVFVGGMTDPLHANLSDVVNGQVTPPRVASKHACAVFADEAIRFLREHRGGPFFCYVPFDAPHDPHIVPEDFPVHYDAARIPLPANFLPRHPWDNGEMNVRDERLLPWPRTPERVRAMVADYYRYISYLDAQIGRVLDALAASPFAKNTIVVFSADSGVARGSHGLIGKQNLYEHSIRVPLIIAGPGIPAGRRTEALCYLFDVLPTLGKLCGVESPPASEGFDLGATLRDPSHAARPELMFAYKQVQRALRDERWKLIRYPQVDQTQLFDLLADPYETNNLAVNPAYAATRTGLTARLEKEMEAFGDPGALRAATPAAARPHITGPTPKLVLPGTEQLTVEGRPAFIFWPPATNRSTPQPWVFYAPTLPAYPDQAERWMHEQFLAAGIAVAGVDVGEAYGSPRSHVAFDALYHELVDRRGFAPRPCLLGRSRGGLWVSSWAIANPARVAGIAGIYPVFDFRTYPGLTNAAPAYGLTPSELATRVSELNPVSRLAVLPTARVPVFLIHGDADTVVPLRENSGELVRRYREAGVGDLARLVVLPGQGHSFYEGFFLSRELVNFVVARARAGASP